MILRSASSLDLNLRAAKKSSSPPCKTGARLITTAPSFYASPRGCKPLHRTSSDGNLYEMQAIQAPDSLITKTKTERSVGDFNGGFNGRGGDDTGGNGGDGGGGGGGNVDGYYEEMIQRYPGDALLLSNYARFLKEVKGDERKAEEYCERAMLTENGRDGEILSMYGEMLWRNHGDGVRAQSYFDQAVQSSPNDCNVLASYARFLWDTEEEEEYENGISTYKPTSLSAVS